MLAIGARFGDNLRRTALWVAAATSLGGCADLARVTSLKPQAIDSTSAVAEQVRAASRADVKMPSFRDVPPRPTDLRQARTFRAAVNDTNRAGAQLSAYAAANPILVDPAATEAFADSQRARIPADQRGFTPDPAGADELAARLRALAAPPPPPK